MRGWLWAVCWLMAVLRAVVFPARLTLVPMALSAALEGALARLLLELPQLLVEELGRVPPPQLLPEELRDEELKEDDRPPPEKPPLEPRASKSLAWKRELVSARPKLFLAARKMATGGSSTIGR